MNEHNAGMLVMHVRKILWSEGYRESFEVGPEETMTAIRAPSIQMCLAKLGLAPSAAPSE